jgi:4-hydroxy-tetrahydrodipicolinate synthase
METEATKALFADSESNTHYVALEHSRAAYSKLVNSTKNPFKIILMYGRPGSGKSYLMQMFYDNHKNDFPIFFFKEPTFDKTHSLQDIFAQVTGETLPEGLSFARQLDAFKQQVHQAVYILLDEAQLYDDVTLEWIRILSNTPIFKFIIAVHKVDREDVLAKAHFKTRTFETIELAYLSQREVEHYIEKKLLLGNNLELLTLFSKNNYRLIHKLTGGNLRDINRLMIRTLEILEHRMGRARTFFGNKLKNKYIEMAALDLKMHHG